MALTLDDKGATFLDAISPAADRAEDVDSGPLYLIVLSGGLPGAMIRLAPGSNAVGRSDVNALQIAEPTISRRHAQIVVDDRGDVRLVDLGSSNGTFLNNRRIPADSATPLREGDRIRFGSNVVVKFARPDTFEERFQREMFERSVRDPLTGLFHRSYFLEQVVSVVRKAESRGLGLAVLMIDVDHFKRVNDTFGHDAGDEVLREVAQAIRLSTRAEDLVARFGGEEFVAALPIANPDQATERAERIRKTLSQRKMTVGESSLRITASIGLCFAPPGRHRAVSALISSADRGLYQAKRSGRDCVCMVAEPAIPAPAMTTVDD